jgi:hypothetical protein
MAGASVEGSRIDANPLCFSYDTDLEKNRQGTRSVQVAPGTPVDATAWLGLIRTQSDHEVARRLGIADRQVRRIKTGKVSEARMREHAKADPEYTKDHCRPCPTWARAAPFLLAVGSDPADNVCRITA